MAGNFRQNEQNNSHRTIVISVIATALLVGGGVYVWQRSNLKSTGQKLRQQIMNLQNQINQLQQLQPNQNTPDDTESTTIDDRTLTDYQNKEYGFEFQYLKNWPQPTMTEGYFSGGYPQEKSKWTLNIGIIGKGPCEGEDCAQYELGGFSFLDYNSALASLRKNENDFINKIREIEVNGLKIITYIESGLRADQTALIFGPTQTLKFVNVWGEEKYFNQIISSFKSTK